RPGGIPTGMEPWKAERMNAGTRGEGVAAEVVGVGVPRLDRLRDDAARGRRQEAGADPSQKATARALPGERVERLSDSVPLGHLRPPPPPRPGGRRQSPARSRAG